MRSNRDFNATQNKSMIKHRYVFSEQMSSLLLKPTHSHGAFVFPPYVGECHSARCHYQQCLQGSQLISSVQAVLEKQGQ